MGDDRRVLISHFPKEVLGKTGENIYHLCRESPWAPRESLGSERRGRASAHTSLDWNLCPASRSVLPLPPSTEIRLPDSYTRQAWSRDGARTAKREKRQR